MIDLIKTDESLLLYLALHGPTIGNRMKPEVKNASRNAKTLKRVGMIEVEYTDEYSRAAGILSLTAFGLRHILILLRPEEWKPVIDSWPNLFPYVIGKWDVFVNAGVEDLAMRKLKIAAEEMSIRTYSGPLTADGYTPLSYDDEFYYRFYRSNEPILEREEQLRWAEACDTDPGVRHYFRHALLIDLDLSERLLQTIEFMQQTLQDNDENRKKTDPRKR